MKVGVGEKRSVHRGAWRYKCIKPVRGKEGAEECCIGCIVYSDV